jgi:hypothetical protein
MSTPSADVGFDALDHPELPRILPIQSIDLDAVSRDSPSIPTGNRKPIRVIRDGAVGIVARHARLDSAEHDVEP